MRWKVLIAIWIITVVSLWIFGSLILATITSNLSGSEGDAGTVITNYLTDPMGILAYIVIGTILTPCMYCYGKVSDEY